MSTPSHFLVPLETETLVHLNRILRPNHSGQSVVSGFVLASGTKERKGVTLEGAKVSTGSRTVKGRRGSENISCMTKCRTIDKRGCVDDTGREGNSY